MNGERRKRKEGKGNEKKEIGREKGEKKGREKLRKNR